VSDARDHASLEERLGHRFAEPELLGRALTHRSWANESRGGRADDNEKLEFLGDAVLALVVGHLLFSAWPALEEGELSIARAQVVSEAGLARIARELGLGAYLRLGRGEDKSGGRDKPSLLADALEAVVAAIYLDGGFEAARAAVARLLGDRLAEAGPTGQADAKTRLQERAQATVRAAPEYRLVGEVGPDHDKVFEVAVVLLGKELARATGKSKKAAEQRAAAAAAAALDAAPPGDDD
jgi:ribonuclease-3